MSVSAYFLRNKKAVQVELQKEDVKKTNLNV